MLSLYFLLLQTAGYKSVNLQHNLQHGKGTVES